MIESDLSNDTVWDLCIVGTGPVGMAMALECDRLGDEVLVLESGGSEVDPAMAEASRAQIVDKARHADMEIAVCRALGGTSWTWGGRCVAYDDVDWIQRDFVADARWPLTHDAMRPWYTRAAEYLLCGNDIFSIPYKQTLAGGLTLDAVERWSREPKLILEHRNRLLESPRIKLSLKSTVTGLNLSADGRRVESLAVSTPQGVRTVKARRMVLAMGGVETTRLLLHTQQRWPGHFGGVDGPLGRYYMGHISGKIASIVFNDPDSISELDFKLDESGAYHRRRFMLTADAQLEQKVLNTAFWPDNPSFYDPNHGSGVLSGVFLVLAFPPTGRRLLSEAIRRAHTGPKPYRLGPHLRNAILGAPRGAKDVYRILRDRFIKKPRKPGFLVSNKGGKYALHYHAEQVPNPDSRITLGRERDSFDVPRAVIDLRFTDQDVRSAIDSHKLLDEALQLNGIGRLQYLYSPEQLQERVYAQASDGYHQVGSTRMGEDPAQSVVDPSLKVHGLENLFVASSSVFPTSGQANSTLLAVAFGIRLTSELHKGQPNMSQLVEFTWQRVSGDEMKDIELGNSGLRAPRLGFGCSAILGRSGRTESLRALAAAWGAGIRFFDTARSYGYGESEELLGEFLRGRRDQAVIATKFGILAARQSGWKRAAKTVARKILAAAPSARSVLQKGAATQIKQNQFTIPVLQRSIEESLRKLGTDHVDLLFLHAAPASVLEQDDLLEAMSKLVEAGKVKIAGLSAEPEVVELAIRRKTPPLRAMQFPCNVFTLSAASTVLRSAGEYICVANQPYGGVAKVRRCREVLRTLVERRGLDAVLCEKLGSLEGAVFADAVLNVILQDRGIHVVIPTMMQVEHIRANVQAVANSRFDSREIAQIREALDHAAE